MLCSADKGNTHYSDLSSLYGRFTQLLAWYCNLGQCPTDVFLVLYMLQDISAPCHETGHAIC